MSRVKDAKRVEEGFICDPEDVRFGTPKDVADYRARRLKCGFLVELGAGVGFQTIAFARTCKKVLAVEIDPKRVEFMKDNLARSKIKNVEIICGDALDPSIVAKAKSADFVFVDTERPPAETERSIASIKPDVKKTLKEYAPIAKGICIEVPPHLDIPAEFDCEKEFISLDGRLNRLNLYFKDLKRCGTSVVLLPDEKRVEGNSQSQPDRASSAKGFSFLYEIDPALQLSGLTGEIAKKAGSMSIIGEGRKSFLLSKAKKDSPFLLCRKICRVCEESYLKEELAVLGCGKALLRYSIDPEEYWIERARLEKGLKGDKAMHLFKFETEFVLCE